MSFDAQQSESEREKGLDAWLALTGQLPAPDQSVSLVMLSGSMNPAIPVGAKLQILVQNGLVCRVGDVAVFLEAEQKLTAHRILLKMSLGPWQWVLEKGDANALGRWRRIRDIRGLVLSWNDEKETVSDLRDSVQASRSLRTHLRNWVKSCLGFRSLSPESNGINHDE